MGIEKIYESLLRMVLKPNGTIAPQGTNAHIYSGYGTPETNVVADIGSIYLRTDGGIGTSIYVKESNNGEKTGWIGK